MPIKQISVFLDNQQGRLAEVIGTIAAAGINLQALSLAETKDFGMLRLILDDPEKAQQVLKSGGFIVQVTDVIAVEVEDKPGGLSRVLEILTSARMNIEYCYASIERRQNNAIIVLKIESPVPAVDLLKQNHIPLVTQAMLKDL